MYGAILGDMIGAPYESDRGHKTKDFPLFTEESHFTDDSVMTLAVAEALLDTLGGTEAQVKAALVRSMQKWGHRYPNAGYGGMFYRWLRMKNPKPYGSFGNGSAMRVAAAGWLYDSLEETRQAARWTAEVTHNHPEGVKGAESVAAAIWLARHGSSKEEIKDYIVREFGYDLSRTCDELPGRPSPRQRALTRAGMSSSRAPSSSKLRGIPMEVRKLRRRSMPSRAVTSGWSKSIWQPQTRTAAFAKRMTSWSMT